MRFNQKNKPAQKTRPRLWKKAVLFSLFFILLFSSFLPANPASAKDITCRCYYTFKGDRFPFTIAGETATQDEKDQCMQMCISKNYKGGEILYGAPDAKSNVLIGDPIMGGVVSTEDPPSGGGIIVDAITHVINWALIIVLRILGWIFDVAMVLFAWVADAENLNRVISNEGVRFGWTAVRDMLNISFILILLFTAFAIVFQVDKYNKKTTILTLVIMALLINFSFPITRAIIDASNILMYTIIKNISEGTNALGTLTGATGVHNIINSSKGASTTALLASIIFVFILMITMLAISLMLVIRIVVLAILIIFSPIAFVPLPGNSYGADWWKKLFSYCFFGPIMMFMILIATHIMSYMRVNASVMKKLADSHTIDSKIISDMAYFAIPIIILWIGMGMAKKMGIDGADAVMGRAQKMSKWAGKKFSGAGAAQRTYKAYQARRQEAQKSSLSNKLGTLLGSKQDWVRSGIPLPGKRDAALRYQRDQAARVRAEAERNDTANMDIVDLRNLAKNGNKFEQAAAKLELANQRQSAGENSQEDLDSIRNTFGETSQIFRQLNAKVRAFDPVAAFSHIGNDDEREAKLKEHVNSSQFDAKKLSANSFAGQRGEEFMRIALQNQAISNSDLDDLAKKSISHKKNITDSLSAVAGDFTQHIGADPANLTDQEKEQQKINQNVQVAHLAQTGKVHTSMDAILDDNNTSAISQEAKKQIFGKLNRDSAKNLEMGTINKFKKSIANNVSAGEYKKIIEGMKNNDARKALNDFMKNPATVFPPGSNGASIRNIIRGDSYLRNL